MSKASAGSRKKRQARKRRRRNPQSEDETFRHLTREGVIRFVQTGPDPVLDRRAYMVL